MSIQRTPVESSQITSIGHEPETQTLEIEFKTGGVYRYKNVTDQDYAELMGTDRPKEKHSVGSHFYRHIKSNADKFPFERVDVAIKEGN